MTLRDFAYLPDLYGKLNKLAAMIIPEPWRFAAPEKPHFNDSTHVLERHLYLTFDELMRRRKYAADDAERNSYVHLTPTCTAFNTGLLTPLYQDVYAHFEPNRNPQWGRCWTLTGFFTEAAAVLEGIAELPKPLRFFPDTAYGFHPDWPLRLNLEHMLCSEENLNRLPASIRDLPALAQTMEACAEQSMRRARYTPSIAVPQWYSGHLQYLLPLFITDKHRADVALTLEAKDGFYLAYTALTLEMAYGNARLVARPEAAWLRSVLAETPAGLSDVFGGDKPIA
jgi:hypothetical protein